MSRPYGNEDIRRYYILQTCGTGYENSPVNFADKIQAPVLLIHGDSDTRVPTEQSLKMQEALRKAKRPVELVLVPGAGHGFTGVQSQHAWSATMKFFSTHLGHAADGLTADWSGPAHAGGSASSLSL